LFLKANGITECLTVNINKMKTALVIVSTFVAGFVVGVLLSPKAKKITDDAIKAGQKLASKSEIIVEA
jgi:hypothetical protein